MITLYTKDNCSYCTKTKQFLDYYNIEYDEINTDTNETARDFIRSQHETLPQIYKNGKLLIEGGYSGLMVADMSVLLD